jgi:hypothetical protein
MLKNSLRALVFSTIFCTVAFSQSRNLFGTGPCALYSRKAVPLNPSV